MEWQETLRFCEWMLNNPYLKPYHEPEDQLIAIAQHYGFPTDLLDFTYNPKIAGYFATSGDINLTKLGVIFIVDTELFTKLCKMHKIPENLTLKLEIKGLWRLENQKGIFLRDYGDFMQQIDYMGTIEFFLKKILFMQKEGITIKNFFPEIKEEFVYPEPNDLEREIERYEQIRLRTRPIDLKFQKVILIGRDPLGEDIEEQALPTIWKVDEIEKWSSVSQLRYIEYPRINNNELIEMNFIDLTPGLVITDALRKHITIIQEYRNRVSNKRSLFVIKPIVFNDIMDRFDDLNRVVFFNNFEYEEFNKLQISKKLSTPEIAKAYFIYVLSRNIQEILQISTILPYSDLEVAKSIQTSFSIVFNSKIHNLKYYEKELISSYVFGNKIIGIEYEDAAGIVSNSLVPQEYFDKLENMTLLRKDINILYPQYKFEKNFQLFQIIHDIRKIMSLEEAIDLWATIIVPSDIFFRSKESRILNPYYVNIIGYD